MIFHLTDRQETTRSTRLSVGRVGKEARPLEVLVMFRGNGAGPVQDCPGIRWTDVT